MDFLRVKMEIRRYCKAACMFILVTMAVCGCGAEKVTYCVDNTVNNQEAGNGIKDNKTDSSIKPVDMKTGTGDKSKSAEAENMEDESKLYKNVPVYGKSEKKKIKKYLASLPDKITKEEAKKKGIVIQLYNNMDGNDFSDIWQGFYNYVMEGEKLLKLERGIIKGYGEPHKAAIVLLRHTTEGDACYIYISFIKDKYYIISDGSRDKFKADDWDGFDEIGTFKSLRKRKKITRDGEKSYCNIIYSVFKKPYISKKEIKKVIKKTSSYGNKYYDLYDYYTSNI